MNRVSLIGRITKDPEIRYSQSGSAYLSFTLAVNRQQRDANGNTQADFIPVTVFGQPAEFIGRYVKKGFLLSVVGRIQTRTYQGQDGQTRYVTEVVCEQVENLTPRDPNAQPSAYQQNGYQQNNQQNRQYNNPGYGNQQQGYNNPGYGSQQQSYQQSYSKNTEEQAPEAFVPSDDDLPF